jgi:hypothetical protein
MAETRKAASMLADHSAVLRDLKERFSVYHRSNIFFRDIQYGIQAMLREEGIRIGYAEAERLAREFAGRMEQERIFDPIDRQSWALRYPDFKTPTVEKPAAAQGAPASGKQAPAGPAGASGQSNP